MVELEAVEAARDRSPGVRAANARDELAELRGRYQELRERIVALEAELAEERRRTGRLEALADRAA
jgi:predicted  nucleic acid-binding Zn-ribbon protein